MIKMYNKLVLNPKYEYLNCVLIQGNKGFEHCVKEKGLFNYATISKNEQYPHMKDVNYYELDRIVPPFPSMFLEYEFLDKPTQLQDLPDLYGVHTTYTQDENFIYEILTRNEYMISQYGFSFKDLRAYIEKNVGYLCMFNLFWQNSGNDNIHNYTIWIILCDFNGRIIKLNEDIHNNSAVFGIVNEEFFSGIKDFSKKKINSECNSLLSLSNEFIKVACVILSSVNSGEFSLSPDGSNYKLSTRKNSGVKFKKVEYKGAGVLKSEIMTDAVNDYYKTWVDTPIPALNNMTPREATESKNGRVLLENLFNYIANQEETRMPATPPFRQVPKFPIKQIRTILRLDENIN